MNQMWCGASTAYTATHDAHTHGYTHDTRRVPRRGTTRAPGTWHDTRAARGTRRRHTALATLADRYPPQRDAHLLVSPLYRYT
ncbi:unnamed protein product [Euphydryas editha]|uniref:Uncharacterized protein n=1 Tax=Euphydryas editha TaxID=104508 RepID=A0AAU9TE44_EUPED|nr:unnamed protein product [Euphydryas editha]